MLVGLVGEQEAAWPEGGYGGNPRQALEPPQIAGRRLADQRREGDAGPDQHLVAVELGARENSLQLEDDGLDAAVRDQHVVATADHDHRQLFPVGEIQSVADVLQVPWHDEELGGTAEPQRRVEAEWLLEPDGAGNSR